MQVLNTKNGYAIPMDVTNEQQIINCVYQLINAHSRIDLLINNAGCGLYEAVEEVSLEAVRMQFDVNIFGLARITKDVLPYMQWNMSGTTINIPSLGGKIYSPLDVWYQATKHALEGWSDCQN